MRNIIVLAVLALILSAALGCAPQEPGAEVSGETDIDSDISMLEDIDADLDMSELESLEQEFAELEELFS